MAAGPVIATPASAAGAGAARAVGPQPVAMAAAVAFLVGVTFFGAWFVLGRRRRPAADGGLLMGAALFGPVAAPLGDGPALRSPRVPDDEENMPRWLRPSVRQERAWTPSVNNDAFRESRRASRFEEPIADSATRLSLRHDGVLLLNVPSEAYATPITKMRTGDEVEVLEVADEWVRVRTPWGDEGWLLSMALGAPPVPPPPSHEPRRSLL